MGAVEGLLEPLAQGSGRTSVLRVSYVEPDAPRQVADTLETLLLDLGAPDRPVTLLCIGTDRSTGDALGPLVGSRLPASLPGVVVCGTLAEPLHASNLLETLGELRGKYPTAIGVAIDACLGRVESVGTITVGKGALVPGAGVNKSLPEVGHCYIAGTVNVGGFMEYFVLQNTRLNLVVRIADVIAEGITLAVTRCYGAVEAAASVG